MGDGYGLRFPRAPADPKPPWVLGGLPLPPGRTLEEVDRMNKVGRKIEGWLPDFFAPKWNRTNARNPRQS